MGLTRGREPMIQKEILKESERETERQRKMVQGKLVGLCSEEHT